MIEYLHDAIRASSGTDIEVVAKITNEDGTPIIDGCGLMFYLTEDKAEHFSGNKLDDNGNWLFVVPAEYTKGLKGRYFYCICQGSNMLCFKTPLYLV